MLSSDRILPMATEFLLLLSGNSLSGKSRVDFVLIFLSKKPVLRNLTPIFLGKTSHDFNYKIM